MEQALEYTCPVCKVKSLSYTTTTINVPYFGDILQTTLFCKTCRYKHTDMIITSIKEPVRYEYRISCKEDMLVRVVRSTTARIKIPELGAVIEPGPQAEAFVSNIEGVLERVKTVLEQLAREEESREKALQLINKLERLKLGEARAKLIIEDPLGNSAIISKRAKVQKLA